MRKKQGKKERTFRTALRTVLCVKHCFFHACWAPLKIAHVEEVTMEGGWVPRFIYTAELDPAPACV